MAINAFFRARYIFPLSSLLNSTNCSSWLQKPSSFIMDNQSPRQCYFNGKLRAPTSRLSLPSTLASHLMQDHCPAVSPVSLLRYLRNAPPLRNAPDPYDQASGAGYVEEFRSNQARAKNNGVILKNRMRDLSQQSHSSFAEVSPEEAKIFGVRVVAPGRVFHPFKKLWEIPYGRPRYQEDLIYDLVEELIDASPNQKCKDTTEIRTYNERCGS